MAKFTINGTQVDSAATLDTPLLWVIREDLGLTGTKFGCGVGFGLTAALYGNITLENGAVVQGNFDTYPVLRINEMPVVEVHIVPSTEKPTGVGEPGTPPIAPAVVNALYALTGKRIRKLPIEV